MTRFEIMKNKLAAEYAALDDQSVDERERGDKVILVTAAVCAGIAVQPLPFADIAILTPLQGFMAMKIANIKGFDFSRERAGEIVVELGGIVGMGFTAQQTVIALYKIGLPFAGGLFTIPLVFGFTYAMGKVTEYYFDRRQAGEPLDKNTIKEIWSMALKEGQRIGRSKEADIRAGIRKGGGK